MGASGRRACASVTVAAGLDRRQVREPEPGAGGRGVPRPRARLDARGRRRRAAAARVPRPLPRRLRGVRARPRPARPDAPQPLGLEGHARGGPASLVRETRFVEIGPVTAFSRRAGRRAAAVPRAPLRLGARPPLGRARGRARLAARRRRRAARAPRVRRSSPPPTRATRPRRRRPASSPSGPTSRATARARCSPSTAGRAADVRLLFVCPDMRIGGAERHWATLIPALHERGVEP